ncbi:hypothetical protein BDY19DRAFT_996290 [Irpex rosettiformis]|uniref:Uncharacterized protein n=1 Tax=Irpex rosettiformis TaxID=378272 RepID=A0ACB8TVV3_9APHY|nr:hypothetical protein BDY19DRAFT_996290 [Irpex rosettiformis]
MSDGFIPVKSKKSRRQCKYQEKKPQPRFKHSGWGALDGEANNPTWFKPKSHFGECKACNHKECGDCQKDFVSFWKDNVLAAERGEEMKKVKPVGVPDRGWSEANDGWGQGNGGWGQDNGGWGQGNGGWGQGNDSWGKIDDGGCGTVGNDRWEVGKVGKPNGDEVAGNGGTMKNDGWGTKEWKGSYGPWAPGKDTCDEWGRAFEGKVGRKLNETPKNRSVGGSAEKDKKDEKRNSFINKVARRQGASGLQKKMMMNFYSLPTSQKVQKIEEIVDFFRKTWST